MGPVKGIQKSHGNKFFISKTAVSIMDYVSFGNNEDITAVKLHNL